MAGLWTRMFPSPTLARYTGRLFAIRTLAFLAGLILILQSLDLLGESGRILAVEGNGSSELWRYVRLRSPQLVALFLPFSALLAALLTFLTLNQNSEIVILKASGLSAHQILAPLLVAGLGIAAVNFAFNEIVLTRAKAEFDVWKAADYRPLPKGHAASAMWVRSGADLVHVEAVYGTDKATRLERVSIFEREDNKLVRVIRAASAIPSADGWQLNDARVLDMATGREESLQRLDFPSGATPQQFTLQDVHGATTPFWRLFRAIGAQEAAGKPTEGLRASLHHKVAGPLSAALMPLLAAVAGFGLARSGKLFIRAIIGLALGFAFFVADNFAMAMADFGNLPPVAAAWAPFILFFLIGESVLLRSEE